MNPILFFDTETTGLPDWKSPSGGESQPHLVQLGAICADADDQSVIQTLDVIIKPDGWIIPDEVAEIHGITTERAMDEGVPEKDALEQFLALRSNYPRVAHNRTFDQRIIRIATKRYSEQDVIDNWAEKEDFQCTMLMAKPIMELSPKGRYGYKNPKLVEALKHFTGKDLENAHTAMADTKACMEVYFAIKALDKS